MMMITLNFLTTCNLLIRYGEKRYSRCYARYASTANNCRDSSYRNYDSRDRYDRYNRYGRYGDIDRYDDKINVGRGGISSNYQVLHSLQLSGRSRIINGGRDAELTCEFPVGSHIISNIIWERDDRLRSRARSYNRYDYRE